ncbi:MAG: 5-formyltetrahydrofolate cyclo-ligase [Elusimicrobiota bacterium]
MLRKSPLIEAAALARRKFFLRNYFKRAVLQIPAARRRKDSLRIASRLARLPVFRRARTVALYISLPFEVDTRPLLALCRSLGKTVAAPVLDLRRNRIVFSRLDRRHLRKNVYGVPEPASGDALPPASLDLYIVPGRAFTPRGGRLGAGGGHYDRLFQRRPRAPRIALAYDEQITPRLPSASFDRPVHIVLTPTKIYKPVTNS